MNQLILFYLGSHPDNKGRYLQEILAQDDLWMETTHDYIQWLFPTKEKSRVTPGAPTITAIIQNEFHNDELLKNHLRASFYRMLSFYGLKYNQSQIVKASNWKAREKNWFTQDTHNNLRITRILKSVKSLGLTQESQDFFTALQNLRKTEDNCGIGDLAFKFWNEVFEENIVGK